MLSGSSSTPTTSSAPPATARTRRRRRPGGPPAFGTRPPGRTDALADIASSFLHGGPDASMRGPTGSAGPGEGYDAPYGHLPGKPARAPPASGAGANG